MRTFRKYIIRCNPKTLHSLLNILICHLYKDGICITTRFASMTAEYHLWHRHLVADGEGADGEGALELCYVSKQTSLQMHGRGTILCIASHIIFCAQNSEKILLLAAPY